MHNFFFFLVEKNCQEKLKCEVGLSEILIVCILLKQRSLSAQEQIHSPKFQHKKDKPVIAAVSLNSITELDFN